MLILTLTLLSVFFYKFYNLFSTKRKRKYQVTKYRLKCLEKKAILVLKIFQDWSND